MGEQKSFSFDEQKHPLISLELKRPLVVFDLETTGFDVKNDRIVQFAFIRINPDRSQQKWSELVNPGISIPPEASKIHNITDDMVRGKPPFSFFAPRITDFLAETDLAGFNVLRFDVPFLQAEMERSDFSLDMKSISILDAQVIFHKKEPRDLSAAYRYYCNGEHADAHDAMADVQVTLEVLDAQIKSYRDLPKNVDGLGRFCSSIDDRWVTQDRKFYWRHGRPVISFGKHKGKDLRWICQRDVEYLKWMITGDFSEDTKKMISDALNGIFPSKEG